MFLFVVPLNILSQTETIILDESWYLRENKWKTDDYSYVQIDSNSKTFYLTERTRGKEYLVEGSIMMDTKKNGCDRFWVMWMNRAILRVHIIRAEDGGTSLHLYSPIKRTDRYFIGHQASSKEIKKLEEYSGKN